MAARTLTSGTKTFYVYLLMDWNGNPMYVGKGSGYRISVSERRFGLSGIFLSWHLTDEEAFSAERKAIEKFQPCLNKCAGGNGGTCRTPSWVREINEVGTKEYARRLCLRFGKGLMGSDSYEALKNTGCLQI